MKKEEFLLYSENIILPTFIELEGRYYPTYASKLHPFCITTLGEHNITITLCEALKIKKKKEPVEEFMYSEISDIEISVVKKPNAVLFLPGTRISLDLILSFENGRRLHLECETIRILPQIINLFSKKSITVKDPLNLEHIFLSKDSIEEVYEYLESNLENMAKEKGISIFRLKQTED
ncbi:hypothetical protein OCD85_06870 [Bacillus pacificus]|uniref:hypothetical protein n=1 Tax=Bacillus cereus group TaxID=86661 RepID=UPI000789E482|nr:MULTISPECIES: hypothetical protein [Bacillus cereus group]KYQ03325.1 hypothetical protein B4079_1513 [Bacillus cereus]MCC2352548.1 hypothetical protein [Bacillus pacificus]MCC2464684.1 hypothetical protein [Bacillus pacificus]MCU5246016.1 hypothetical protein [Bacillus pacificus]MCU5360738.1 hypothetical protein [Bacillus pacificus]